MKTLVIQVNHAGAYELFTVIGITWEVDKKRLHLLLGIRG